MSNDPEILAMGKLVSAMERLDQEQRARVLQWAGQKYSVEVKPMASLGAPPSTGDPVSTHSTNTIATAMNAKSGPDLVISAAAHLHFAQGKQTFTRQEITSSMRSAPAYFKSSYLNNLSKYLTVLTKADRLRLVSTEMYALSNKERQELTRVLGNL